MSEPSEVLTFLFSDIEGSTRLWEQQPAAMRPALAQHDAVARASVEAHGGHVVKTTGDGLHAVFDCPAAALRAALQLQLALNDPAATGGLQLRVRCGLHVGPHERRDGDFYGPVVNRAARISSVAHGGQTLLSQALVERVVGRLPAEAALRDLGAVRLRNLSAPERVHQLLHPKLRAQFPPLRSLESTPNNLAQQLNSFIGREHELAEAKRLLAGNRLLTLLGMGGIGKSRLSVQLGADVLDDYPDGVWLVELAPLTDARGVPQAVASVLGVKEEAGRTVAESLVGYVRDKRVLFILDNCEHLLHACAELAKQLLQGGAGVKVLASSRAALRVAGESCWPVSTLSVPGPRRPSPGVDELMRHEAVRLFVDRATAARAAFRLTPDNAAAVADICHRLDGIPLALELAAARTRALPVEAIAARLSDRFRLLVSGDQTVLPRQRTLRALIDWSHDLLSEPERVLFRRLAVFAGGWTLEAAEAVGSSGHDDGDGLPPSEVPDTLAQLVEKSLVVMGTDGGPDAKEAGERYRMLDTVRHYARERLEQAQDVAATRERHLDFHLQLAERARAALQGAEQSRWLTRLDQEQENLLAAHVQCESDGRRGLRLVFALRPYWLNRGLLEQGYRLTVEALNRADAQQRDQPRLRGLSGAGWLAHFLGYYGRAREHLEQALGIAREAGNKQWIAVVLQPLGMACMGAADVVAAQQHLEEAVALAQQLDNRRELAAATNSLAQFYRMQGRPSTAQTLYEQALSLARELGDKEYIAAFLLNLSMVAVDRLSHERVRRMLIDTLDIAAEIGSKPATQCALDVCAGMASAESDWHHAALFYGVAEAEAQRTGLRRDPADQAFLTPYVALAKHALGVSAFAAIESKGRALGWDQAVSTACSWLHQSFITAGSSSIVLPA